MKFFEIYIKIAKYTGDTSLSIPSKVTLQQKLLNIE